jgi:hypothetical protein
MTTFYQDSDIPTLLSDFGVAVVFQGVSAKGVVDYVDSVTLQENRIGGVINKAITVMVQTSAFPALLANDAVDLPITVDGVAYHIRQRLQTTDGAITHLLCTN